MTSKHALDTYTWFSSHLVQLPKAFLQNSQWEEAEFQYSPESFLLKALPCPWGGMSNSDSTNLQQIIIFLVSSAQFTLQIIFCFFAQLCLLSIYLCGCIFTDLSQPAFGEARRSTWPKQHWLRCQTGHLHHLFPLSLRLWLVNQSVVIRGLPNGSEWLSLFLCIDREIDMEI